jgi:hypothetical protein
MMGRNVLAPKSARMRKRAFQTFVFASLHLLFLSTAHPPCVKYFPSLFPTNLSVCLRILEFATMYKAVPVAAAVALFAASATALPALERNIAYR